MGFFFFIGMMMSVLPATASVTSDSTLKLLIGTYTRGESNGIYQVTFGDDFKPGLPKLVAHTDDPSFLAFHEAHQMVFAVNEVPGREGSISGFSRDNIGDSLRFAGSIPSAGVAPCHIVIAPSGRHLLVSNYAGANLLVFEIGLNGELHQVQEFTYTGSSVNTGRQNAPHIHSAAFSPDGAHVVVQDLGTDHLYLYRYDAENTDAPLSPAQMPTLQTPPGSGPRHSLFHPSGKAFYTVMELSGEVGVFVQENNIWVMQQLLPLHNGHFEGQHGAADLHLSPDAQYLYVSNRGDANDIALFSVDGTGHQLTYIENYSVHGSGPRNFAISPDGKHLLVANQRSNEIVIFNRNQATGKLSDTDKRISVDSPVMLLFVP